MAAELTIDFNFSGGDVTQLSNVCVCDPTQTFGVRRTDTDAVVVAVATDFVNDSPGVYHLNFDDVAPGISYEYWVQWTYRNDTERRQGFKNSQLDALPRYIELADALTLLPSLLTMQYFPAASSTQQTAALTAATADIDVAWQYQGRKFHHQQILEFPRVAWESGLPYPNFEFDGECDEWRSLIGSATIWDWNCLTTPPCAVIPLRVQRASIYQADAVLNPNRGALLERMYQGLKGQRIGSLSEDYELKPVEKMALCRMASSEMSIYRLRAGRIL